MPVRPVLLVLEAGSPAIQHQEMLCQILASSVRAREAKRMSLGFGPLLPDPNSFSFDPLDSPGMESGPKTLSRSQSTSKPGRDVPLCRDLRSASCRPQGIPACSRSFDLPTRDSGFRRHTGELGCPYLWRCGGSQGPRSPTSLRARPPLRCNLQDTDAPWKSPRDALPLRAAVRRISSVTSSG